MFANLQRFTLWNCETQVSEPGSSYAMTSQPTSRLQVAYLIHQRGELHWRIFPAPAVTSHRTLPTRASLPILTCAARLVRSHCSIRNYTTARGAARISWLTTRPTSLKHTGSLRVSRFTRHSNCLSFMNGIWTRLLVTIIGQIRAKLSS